MSTRNQRFLAFWGAACFSFFSAAFLLLHEIAPDLFPFSQLLWQCLFDAAGALLLLFFSFKACIQKKPAYFLRFFPYDFISSLAPLLLHLPLLLELSSFPIPLRLLSPLRFLALLRFSLFFRCPPSVLSGNYGRKAFAALSGLTLLPLLLIHAFIPLLPQPFSPRFLPLFNAMMILIVSIASLAVLAAQQVFHRKIVLPIKAATLIFNEDSRFLTLNFPGNNELSDLARQINSRFLPQKLNRILSRRQQTPLLSEKEITLSK